MSAPPDSPPQLEPTPFRDTLVASGLVEPIALHRIESALITEGLDRWESQDQRLAEKLVEADLLNWWQVDQLRQGRTKFKLGPYRVIDSIARGGMGHVFKGAHEMLGRVEAIKVLPRHKSSAETIRCFEREIRAQAALDHPNLVRVSFADRDGETYYLVTEYVPGIDLRRLIRRHGPVEESVAAYVLLQATDAIGHAHKRGLVHRDVKPGNLLLTPTGQVKVTDLGLAWSLEEDGAASTLADAGKVVGTSDYLAPEAIRDPGRVLAVTDIYGLGCTLYYAITGKVPFPGGSHADKMRRHLREGPPDPRQLTPSLSGEMVTLVLAMMAKDPAQRPASAASIAERLAELTGEGAQEALAAVVTETLARRQTDDEESTGWSSSAGDELPETVSQPAASVARADPPHESPPEAPRPVSLPTVIAIVAALIAFAILAVAAFQA